MLGLGALRALVQGLTWAFAVGSSPEQQVTEWAGLQRGPCSWALIGFI